jgi:hypothetical protein
LKKELMESMYKLPRERVSENAEHDGILPERIAGRLLDSLARQALNRGAGRGRNGMAPPAATAREEGPLAAPARDRRDWPTLTVTDRHWPMVDVGGDFQGSLQ